jgi:hypothetical protein
MGRSQGHDRLQAAVAHAINAADPIGLFADGAPADEYSPEIDTIVPRLERAQSIRECQDILHEEFVRWFSVGVAGSRDAYANLAADLWQAVLQSRAT